MMVLREEFFPLMEEVKNSVGVMSKAANGNTLPYLSSSTRITQPVYFDG